MAGINYSKAKYFPEILPGSGFGNLVANQPYTFEDLSRFSGGLILKLKGVYTYNTSDVVTIYAGIDGVQRKFDTQSLACMNMYEKYTHYLDIPAKGSLTLKVLSSADVTSYPLFWIIEVTKPTTIEKLLYGVALTDYDKSLIEKYKLTNLVSSRLVISHNDYYVERKFVSYVAGSVVASGTNPQIGSIISAPKNRYIVIDGIYFNNVVGASITPSKHLITINRDSDNEYVSINPTYGNDYTATYGYMPVWIPVTDRFTAYWINTEDIPAGTIIRISYRIYPFGVSDKIRWGFTLTSDEEAVAKEKDLYDKVKAGLI